MLTPIEAAAFGRNCHREERSDVAIQESQGALVPLDCFAIARPEGRASFDALGLAMTALVRPKCNILLRRDRETRLGFAGRVILEPAHFFLY